MPAISQVDLHTTGTDENNEHLFITNILQNALNVKYQNNPKNTSFSARDVYDVLDIETRADLAEHILKYIEDEGGYRAQLKQSIEKGANNKGTHLAECALCLIFEYYRY